MGHIQRILVLAVFVLMALTRVPAMAGEAGRVQFLQGTVQIINVRGEEHGLKKDEVLWEGDTVVTGDDGELQAVMADQAFIAIRPNTRFKIEAYVANGTQEDRVFYSLLVGTLRSITGWIGKYNRDNYKITTPTATIGVRGTDHAVSVVLDLKEGELSPNTPKPGTYDVVTEGTTFMRTQYGVQDIQAGQAGFSASRAITAPVVLDRIPQLVQALPNFDKVTSLKAKLKSQLEAKLRKKQQLLQKLQSGGEGAAQLLPKLLNTSGGQSDRTGANTVRKAKVKSTLKKAKTKIRARLKNNQR
ncbi:MAG: FecR domain-containing protein [Gammaproteobacteria bacterium]|nr:FecR domain-containing protein [Gammaproteobacteria bacterium]